MRLREVRINTNDPPPPYRIVCTACHRGSKAGPLHRMGTRRDPLYIHRACALRIAAICESPQAHRP